MYRFVTFRDLSNFVTSKHTNKTAGSVSFSAQPVYLFSLWLYQERLFWFFRFSLCDRFEQKQACGCILTNPPHVTLLRPGSTVIDGFSKLIPQRIAVEISYLLVYCPWKSINKCDRSEQKQPFGCTLTNPPHVTPLRPGSTVIDGFSRAIYQKIADFNSYPLRYQFWKSVNNCGVGTQWRNVWWIRQGTPRRLLLLRAVTNEELAAIWN